jgi:hypothetical protein
MKRRKANGMVDQNTQNPSQQLSRAHLDELKLLREVIPYAKRLGVPNTNISIELLELLLKSIKPVNL